MKKIYIAGKITGLPWDEVVTKFKTAQLAIEAIGFVAINPIELVNNPNAGWKEAMLICLAEIKKCDGAYFLECSQNSRGAKIELEVAIKNNLTLFTTLTELEQWNS